MSYETQLEALLEIINTSAREAIAEYKKGDNQVPAIHSKTYHPIDFATDNVALKKAVRLLEGACQQLCASLAPPQHTLHNYAMSFEWACVRIVMRAKVADVLERFPEGLHVDELAKLVNLDKGKLARVLRLLAIKGCFTEVAPNTFTNNRISLVTHSSSNSGALSQRVAEENIQGAVVLYETMTKPDYATSYEADKSPLSYALKDKGIIKSDGNFFDWMRENPERRKSFYRTMIGFGDITGSLSVLHHYPWNEVKTVCDVGSSIGTVSLQLLKMYPHLKIVDQDLPEVLAAANDLWAKDAPEALQSKQVQFVPLNFLTECPVRGQDVYYLRNIIHDWPDAEAAIILRNLRNVMAPHSRLLIHDFVTIPASRDPIAKSINVDIAPEPLLPNFGHGNNRVYQQDITMWILLNGRERSLDDSIALGRTVGLRLGKVYDLGESAVLEFRMADDVIDPDPSRDHSDSGRSWL